MPNADDFKQLVLNTMPKDGRNPLPTLLREALQEYAPYKATAKDLKPLPKLGTPHLIVDKSIFPADN